MKFILKISYIIFLLLFLLNTSKHIYAQATPTPGNSIDCAACTFSQNRCDPYYNLPRVCGYNPDTCCHDVDPNCGTKYYIWSYPCEAESCDSGWSCQNTINCGAVGGNERPCYIGPGQTGNCCLPPVGTIAPTPTTGFNECTNKGYFCQTNADCYFPNMSYCDLTKNPLFDSCYGTCVSTGCSSSEVCRWVSTPDLCNAQGGNSIACKESDGSDGNCCVPIPPTPPSTYSCYWQSSGFGSCLPIAGSNNCDPGCSDCSQFGETNPTPGLQCAGEHSCVCPVTPPTGLNEFTCRWIPQGFGTCAVSTDSCAEWCFPDCGGFGSDNCQNNNPAPTCTCLNPTGALPTAAYIQCGEYCDQNSEYKYGSCFTDRHDDICIRPAADPNGQIDCSLFGSRLDCWCCKEQIIEVDIKLPFDPLCGSESINTAIGCIPVGSQNAFLSFILRWALGITGGTSFLLIIYSGFLITTSGGDKRRLQSGKELLTAALAGLILIIFSVFILDLIGVRILRIPGLT